jgi:hypothetical protein
VFQVKKEAKYEIPIKHPHILIVHLRACRSDKRPKSYLKADHPEGGKYYAWKQ